MKPTLTPIITPEAERYADEHTSPPSSLLNDIERWAHLNTAQPRMVSGHYQGRVLAMISRMVRPSCVVEIGTFLAYATICLAEGVTRDGIIHTIEVNDEWQEAILHHLDKAQLSNRVVLHIGDAHSIIPTLSTPIDLAYIDADKVSTADYYELILPHMRKGGFIVIDNVLWSGKVLHPEANHDKETQALTRFNDSIQADSRVENLLLPLRDGLMLCRVI